MKYDGSNIVCYWGSGSAPSWRVLICLREKELLSALLKLVSMSKREHKSSEICAINPRGQVPTFRDGDIIINESIAICQYLAETYKNQGTDLLGKTVADNALILQRIHELQNLYIRGITLARYYWKMKPHYTKAIVNTKKSEFLEEIKLWEGYLKTGGLTTDQFTLADVCLFPVIAFFKRLGFNIDQVPNINMFYMQNKKRKSIKESWPPHWKESRNKTIFKNLKI